MLGVWAPPCRNPAATRRALLPNEAKFRAAGQSAEEALKGRNYETKPNLAPLASQLGERLEGTSTKQSQILRCCPASEGGAERVQLRNEAKFCAAVQPARGGLKGLHYETKPNLALLAIQQGER